MTAYYRNEMLFSEIYLEEITRQPEHADVLASLKVLREYRAYADTSTLAAWTQSYIHEVLAALGFNASVKSTGLTLLYPMGNVDQPVSLCFVTLPDESLDNTLMGRNWAEKTIRALRQQGLQWGLLTNGKLWRIYHLDESTPYETYLEIDLESILGDQAKEAYQIFHKFMKADNFVVGDDAKCQFDRFKKDSKDKIDYIQKELANALKQREEGGKGVLSDLTMGYVEEIRTRGESDLDDETLRRKIYHGAMLYMFRLLFLFYADTRGLLSDANGILLSEVETDARSLHNGEKDKDDQYSIWDRLSAIFVDIDQTYNGGLFSPQESEFTQFIEETRCADRYLAETLFNLTTYHEKNGQEHPISYRDMSVRHLGTLYEGLLEHKLFITKEDTEVRVTKGKIEFIPVSHGGKLLPGHYLVTGAVYFGSDPSERKSTGSYYTPEYIVDNIVRNTVGEKLKELKADFLAQEKENLDGLARAVDEFERAALASLLEENALSFVRQKILSLSVLDPAMGSGHFLVNVTNLIANFITEFLNELGIEAETPTGTAYWRRWVVENCIYGVDLNPLAVELAKLSLWILSMAKDQPLSFMNHHLKCGNSLVGARLEEIGNYPFSTSEKEPRQMNMFERDPNFRAAVEDALAKAKLIASHGSASLGDVEEKKAWLAEIEQDLQGYKAICNVHIGLYFGSQVNEEQYAELVEKKDFALAGVIELNQYFHWELEFPEIFLDSIQQIELKSDGFSIVIGNPPYVRGRSLPIEYKKWFESKFASAYKSYDLYVLFVELGIILLGSNGMTGMIIPRSFLTESYGEEIRRFALDNTKIRSIIDYFGMKIFEDASVINCVPIFQRINNPVNLNDNEILVVLAETNSTHKIRQGFFREIPQFMFRVELTSQDTLIVKRLSKDSMIIGDICYVSYSIAAHSEVEGKGKDEYLSHQVINEKSKRFIEGKEVNRYAIDWQGRYLLYDPKILRRPSLPELFENPKITVLGISGTTGITATFDEDHFYVGYPAVCLTLINFLKDVKRSDVRFAENEYVYSSHFDLRYVLGILNSKLMKYYFDKMIFSTSQTIYSGNIRELPLRKIIFKFDEKAKKQQLVHVTDLYLANNNDGIRAFVQHNLPNQTEIIHDVLAYLVEQMIDRNKQRQSEVNRFLDWLQKEIGASLDELTSKTIIQNFLGNYQKNQRHATLEEILSVLQKNQKRLQVSAADNTFQGRLDAEYQASLEKLLPIKERLATTDRLIDQIVYQLYDLTEEEIAIVESED